MNNETILHDALAAVLPAFHLALDGKPEAAAVYRTSGERTIFESDTPILTRELFQVHIYQREYDSTLMASVRSAVLQAGFILEGVGAQVMAEDYYRDELRFARRKED